MTQQGSSNTRRGESTRSAIIAAASELIAEKGVEGFTMSDVARRASINRALIYHYFTNRDNLVFQAIRHVMANASTANIEGTPETAERFTRMHIEHPEIGRFFFQMLLSGRELPGLNDNLFAAIKEGERLKRANAPWSGFDPTFAVIHTNLGQLAWSFARHEVARHLGLSVEEADERFIGHLRRTMEFGLPAMLSDEPPGSDPETPNQE